MIAVNTKISAAREDVTHALEIDPGNSDARGLQQAFTTAAAHTAPHHPTAMKPIRAALTLLLLVFLHGISAYAARPVVVFLRLDDTIQPIAEDYFNRALDYAAQTKADALLIELNTPGGLLSTTRNMVGRIGASAVPVIVYVAPEGARAGSAGFFLLEAAESRPWRPAPMPAHPIRSSRAPSSTTP